MCCCCCVAHGELFNDNQSDEMMIEKDPEVHDK
jgi:hypothetical protein